MKSIDARVASLDELVKRKQVGVACITTDYAMQNVLLQVISIQRLRASINLTLLAYFRWVYTFFPLKVWLSRDYAHIYFNVTPVSSTLFIYNEDNQYCNALSL